nr:peptidoglycan-binding protein [Streptomyces coryli]
MIATAAVITGLLAGGGVIAATQIAPTSAAAASACSYSGSHNMIQNGSRGAAVQHAQCILNKYAGHGEVAIDGDFGPITRNAVIAFQRARGLEADGIIGPHTWSALHQTADAGGDNDPPAWGSGITRDAMLQRAKSWLNRNIRYSQSAKHDGYRTDCSGYVSMALDLRANPITTDLATATYTHRLGSMNELRPGDLVIDATGSNTTRHVVIFNGWTDTSHTAYQALEMSGSAGTVEAGIRTYGLGADHYDPYRPNKLVD